MRRRRLNRVKPLLDLKCDWDGHSVYPATIRVAMDNGTFADYRLAPKQPAPRFFGGQEGMVVGYKFRGNKN